MRIFKRPPDNLYCIYAILTLSSLSDTFPFYIRFISPFTDVPCTCMIHQKKFIIIFYNVILYFCSLVCAKFQLQEEKTFLNVEVVNVYHNLFNEAL